MMDNFKELVEELPESFETTAFTESGVARVSYSGEDIAVILPDAEPNLVYFRLTVGSGAHCDRSWLVHALLRANAFWQGAAGAALSLKDDVVSLTDRRSRDAFADPDGLAAYLENFVASKILWHERLELHRGKEA